MNGDIAALYRDGQQVGGLLDWDDDSAEAYWVFGDVPEGQYRAKFYAESEGALTMRREADIDIFLPPCTLDKLIRYRVGFSVHR